MSALVDFVFPPRCAGCDRPGTLLCDRCSADIVRIDPATACARCGAPLRAAPCAECGGRPFAFSAARCAALLEPPVSRAIVVLKDGGERRYARVLAAVLAESIGPWLEDAGLIVPVPASPAALRRRGFDHASDLALALGRATGLPAARLLRAHPGADQRELGRDARFRNRLGAFYLDPAASRHGVVAGARIVLVDDVLTTGASFDAASRALLDAGAGEVRAAAVARSIRM